MDAQHLQLQQDIVLDACKDTIARTRRVLFVVSVLIGLSVFHLFDWYLSWDLARIEARTAIVDQLRPRLDRGPWATGDAAADRRLVERFEAEAIVLTKERDSQRVEVPILSMQISKPDISVLLVLSSTAVLLWLLFYQRRFQASLRALERLAGSDVALRLLEHHFALIGTHSTRPMRIASRALLVGLPLLALCFFLSDAYDLAGFASDPIRSLAFQSDVYLMRVGARLGVGAGLTCLVGVLGWRCFKEFVAIERDVLKFARPNGQAGV